MNFRSLLLALLALTLSACSLWPSRDTHSHSGSVVDYLYPDAKASPQLEAGVTTLRPPVNVGIAFVPGSNWNDTLTEAQQTQTLERVKAAFTGLPYVGRIEVIPPQYLRSRGGFTNLDQAARMFNVEIVTLVSYDQIQFKDQGMLSMLYWTLVGAYVIHGDKYDVQTMVDAAVFDVASRKLLFRAPGTSQIKGSSTLVNFSEASRNARGAGFDQAFDDLIPRFKAELDHFRDRLKTDKTVRVQNKAGYSGGGSLGTLGLLLIGALWGLKRRALARR
jgi:rhombotail lipoprotein